MKLAAAFKAISDAAETTVTRKSAGVFAKGDAKKKDATHGHGHTGTTFAAQLAQAQAMVLPTPFVVNAHPKAAHGQGGAPHAAHGKREPLTATRGTSASPPAAAERAPEHAPSQPKETSARTEPVFSVEAPREASASSAPAAPPPAWAPKELIADDTARMVLFPNAVNFVSEGQAMQLQVKNGEVSIRAQGELAQSLRLSENELRVALAQEGLKLKDTDATSQQRNDDATSDDRRQQRHDERQDEWT
ncbi:MAG: hypothetical protein IPJ65_10195 [Archangiaceae bacterium]|nr:hypothetical protein [Archangiaceae bacterium]